ncbi:MAG: MarR family transcriptional regulator [Pyrinomonadaceae bacterium]|nr:MarR family transcriptional regulator [Sphingobacteriaceae bacterium]
MSQSNATQFEVVRIIGKQYSEASMLLHEAISMSVGLSGTDHKYLSLLIDKGEATAGELSILTGLSTGAITGLIDRLEKKGLAKRQLDVNDRRKIIIVPNIENINKLLAPIFAKLHKKTNKLISSFSKKEIAAIVSYFSSATELMKEMTGSLNK